MGLDRVAGYLKDGLRGLQARPELIAFTERVSAGEYAAELLVSIEPPLAVDVARRRRDQKYIAGSLIIPLNRLMENLEQLRRTVPCWSTARAATVVHRCELVAAQRISAGR